MGSLFRDLTLHGYLRALSSYGKFNVVYNYVTHVGTAMVNLCSRVVSDHEILVLPHTVALKFPPRRRGQALILMKT